MSSLSREAQRSIYEGLESTDNIFSYILALPPSELDALYDHTWTCKAVFRFLSDIAKQYVMRMLFCAEIPRKQIQLDVPKKLTNLSGYLDSSTGSKKNQEQDQKALLKQIQDAHENALAQLITYRIISLVYSETHKEEFFVMNSHFQQTFRKLVSSTTHNLVPTSSHSHHHHRKNRESSKENTDHITDEGDHNDAESELEPKKKKRKKHKPKDLDPEFLQEYSKRKWENVLLYLVGTAVETEQSFSENVKELLKCSQLIKRSQSVKITNEGFQFLLQETKVQVWKLLKQYLETAHGRNQSKTEILNFIFELGFLEIGKEYSSKDLTPTQKSVLVDFNDLGIIYLPRDKKTRIKDKYYFPTPLAKNLTVSVSTSYDSVTSFGVSNKETGSGYIIVETNYRVYAYTNSPLQIALLSLFIFPEYRLPNLIVGLITRATIREALKNGITAHQILQFLRLNAHPIMRQKKPVIPDTVSDQIILWEKERNRLKKTQSVVYDKFTSIKDLENTIEYAKSIGALLWSSTEQMMLICRRDKHELMKRFISAHTH
ncbi:hypothetical protein FDP41_008185 [Naegleria fowleri]|uniref:General transcription factor IIH subunit 4 n=1 Tax=Naegleria fowleri TaxID=5763 RepID=A0A6A5BG62_NAEFO|nr:uncharacterized protein FDP41_008185 [Naegleria fowleri]KAF0973481.1 hypothetical protein FDP41_008185 [Naegleria fowleri]CAG4713787.1 unnamed protein product [Naegleria fowleri]